MPASLLERIPWHGARTHVWRVPILPLLGGGQLVLGVILLGTLKIFRGSYSGAVLAFSTREFSFVSHVLMRLKDS